MDFEKLMILANEKNNKFILEPTSFGYNIFGYFSESIGLSQNPRYISHLLKQKQIQHSKINVKTSGKIYDTDENIYDKNIFCINPDNITNIPTEYFKNRYNIGLWAWELNNIPTDWKEASNIFDEIWTVSEFCKKILEKELDTDKKIKVLRVYPYWVKKVDKKISREKLSIFTEDFIFLFITDYNSDLFRKNVLDLIFCFQSEFNENEEASLFLKIKNLPKDFDLGIKSKKITLINHNIKEEDNNYLLNSCDCYISLHRSEGYGLTIIESILLEKPIICTNYSGNLDFCDKNFQELIDYELINVDKDSYYAKFFPKDKLFDLFWAQPNLKQTKIKMRNIFENKEVYNIKSTLYKNKIINNSDIFKFDFL